MGNVKRITSKSPFPSLREAAGDEAILAPSLLAMVLTVRVARFATLAMTLGNSFMGGPLLHSASACSSKSASARDRTAPPRFRLCDSIPALDRVLIADVELRRFVDANLENLLCLHLQRLHHLGIQGLQLRFHFLALIPRVLGRNRTERKLFTKFSYASLFSRSAATPHSGTPSLTTASYLAARSLNRLCFFFNKDTKSCGGKRSLISS